MPDENFSEEDAEFVDMGQPRVRGQDNLKINLLVIAALIIGVALRVFFGRPLYWQLVGDEAPDETLDSCQTCQCDCVAPELEDSLRKILVNLKDFVLPNCGRDDPDMQDELKKSRIQLLEEELQLQHTVSMEAKASADAVINELKLLTTQNSEKSHRCYLEVRATENARERAEVDLVTQRKITHLWENRARALGWKDEGEI